MRHDSVIRKLCIAAISIAVASVYVGEFFQAVNLTTILISAIPGALLLMYFKVRHALLMTILLVGFIIVIGPRVGPVIIEMASTFLSDFEFVSYAFVWCAGCVSLILSYIVIYGIVTSVQYGIQNQREEQK